MVTSTEYEVLSAQVKANKERLIKRLSRMLTTIDNGPNETPCHVWIGAKQNNGYGRINFRHDGRHVQLMTHRVFLTLMLKRPIADGMEAGHTCPNGHRHCVSHLKEQTKADNLRDRDAKQKENKSH